MATLLVRLQGPLQSWGTPSRFDERDTQLEPSKSGVLGLVCAALGRDRAEPVSDLGGLRMGVRVDREGVPMRDYQTARGVALATGKSDAGRTVVSERFYISDAIFLVGLEGDDTTLAAVQDAIRAPHWPICLGRKSFVPSMPVYLTGGLVDSSLIDALTRWPLLDEQVRYEGDEPITRRFVIEHDNEGAVRLDDVVAPFSERQFGPRFVQTHNLTLVDEGVVDVSDTFDA